MGYRVVITPEAQRGIERDLGFMARRASRAVVQRWYAGLVAAIGSLAEMPERCGLIREGPMFDEELRQLFYGRARYRRRVIFVIKGDTVHGVHYRHGSLPPMTGSGGGEVGRS